MVHTCFTPRQIGWSLTILSYLLAAIYWYNLNGSTLLHYICVIGIPLCILTTITLAIKFKCYDLWAGALLSFTSPLVVFGWAAPFF
ncbi:MAG: hypothetical protein Q4A92_07850 [Corynebacterium sp.]|nr:hypothetical protein [Corynebacterium sp.]